MSKTLDCDIIQDLLPSFADGLTSDATNTAVREHLQGCAACSGLLSQMKRTEPAAASNPQEIDYLKKVRRRGHRMLWLGIAAAIVAVSCLFLWRVFWFGFPVAADSLQYELSLEGQTIHLSGRLTDSGTGYSHLKVKEVDATVTITVYAAPAGLFRNSDHFSEAVDVKGTIKKVKIDDLVAFEHDKISKFTAQLYKKKTDYMGDISSDLKIAEFLRIGNEFGRFTNRLQSSKEPYGWTLVLKTPIAKSQVRQTEEKMQDYSAVLLAMIGNLGSVTWEYQSEGVIKTCTIDTSQASAFVEKPIKNCADSPYELELLLRKTNLLIKS